MQDNYVGDIGDYGKYGLLRAIVSQKLELAVNWYKVWPKKLFEKGKIGKLTLKNMETGEQELLDVYAAIEKIKQ